MCADLKALGQSIVFKRLTSRGLYISARAKRGDRAWSQRRANLTGRFIYRVPRNFVPLISCTITFDQNVIFTQNFQRMFISLSSTCIQNFSNGHTLFIFLSHSVAVVAWSGIQRVDSQMIHFELFCHPVRRSQFSPQTIFVQFRELKKYILGIHPKKIFIPAPFHSKAFVLLYKLETSWALLGRLSRGFFCHLRGLLI